MGRYDNSKDALLDGFLLITFVLTFLSVLLIQKLLKLRHLPAGPWGIPFLGYLPFVKGDLYKCLTDLSYKYGNIFSIKLGRRTVVIVNSYDVVQEVLVNQANVFSGIPKDFNLFSYLSMGKGLMTSEGEAAEVQRRLILTAIRNPGGKKGSFEKVLQKEMKAFLHVLRQTKGQPIDLNNQDIFSRFAINVISYLTLGKFFEHDDHQFSEIQDNLNELFLRIGQLMSLELFSFLRILPTSWNGVDEALEAKKVIFELFDRIIDEHEATFDPKNVRDMIDVYFANKQSQNHNTDSTYTRDHLRNNILHLFGSGTSTVAASMGWALKLLAINIDWQKTIQQEMDKAIEKRLPSWSDKDKLPLLEAAILETYRIATISPLSLIHSSVETTTLFEYKLPAGTNVIVNFWRVHYDPTLFPNPEVFDPNRFIDNDGKINEMKDYVLAFSTGKRNCPGETLAKQHLFLFLAAVLQSFTIVAPDGESLTLDATTTLERKLNSCTLRFVPRV